MTGTTLIIGAGSGLSAALARRFAGGNSRVVLASRSTADLDALAEETDAIVLQCDATREADMRALFEQIDRAGLILDTMIYNAGAYARGAITEIEPSEVTRLYQVNAFGAFLAARETATRMRYQGRGTMLFTGASAGVKGYANSAPFAMAKFALRGLCQSLARELAPQNIHVAHFVIDGLIRSLERGSPYNDERTCLDPDRIAETYFQIANQHRSTWTWEIELRPWLEPF